MLSPIAIGYIWRKCEARGPGHVVGGILALGAGRLVSLGHSARDTGETQAMSDCEGENAALTDAGKSTAGSTDLTAQMDLMLQAMQQVREEMKAGQEETALKLERSAKRDPFSFRRKGNEKQFRFCEDVKEQLQSASSSISRAKKNDEVCFGCTNKRFKQLN